MSSYQDIYNQIVAETARDDKSAQIYQYIYDTMDEIETDRPPILEKEHVQALVQSTESYNIPGNISNKILERRFMLGEDTDSTANFGITFMDSKSFRYYYDQETIETRPDYYTIDPNNGWYKFRPLPDKAYNIVFGYVAGHAQAQTTVILLKETEVLKQGALMRLFNSLQDYEQGLIHGTQFNILKDKLFTADKHEDDPSTIVPYDIPD